MREAIAFLLLATGCIAATDAGPDDGAPRFYATEADQTAATSPALIDDAGTVSLPSECVDLAAAPPGGDTPEARRRFMEGSGRFERGDYASAMVEFCASYRADARPALLFNIGVTCERAGLYEEAAEFFEAFAAEPSLEGGVIESQALERAARLRERARR